MFRTVGLILAGVVAGTAATSLWLREMSGRSGEAGSGVPGSFDSSLAAVEVISGAANSTELEQLVLSTAAQSPSWRRDADLRALLMRLVDEDPRAAIELAQTHGVDKELLARLFQIWASTEPNAALAGLGALPSVTERRAVAVALLEVFGLDETGTEMVAAVLPPVEANNFRIDAIGKLAETDLNGAMDRAIALTIGQAETAALNRIAVVMAGIDPLTALAQQDKIVIPLQRVRFRDRVMDEWAKINPAEVLTYLETSPDLTEVLVGEAGFRALATSSPEKLLAVSARFAPQQRAQAERAALDVLASLDPAAAYERIRTLPPGGNRGNLIGTIAEGYAARDPEGALLWASSLEPRSEDVLYAVMSGIGANDPMRATDLVIAEILDPIAANRADVPSLTSVLSMAMQDKSAAIPSIADKLSAHPDPRVRAQLENMLMFWPEADPEAAIDWALRNPESLGTRSAASLGGQLAATNPALARQSLERLPAELRGPWVSGVANGLVETDAAGAEAWILGMPRGAERDGGVNALFQHSVSQGTPDTRLLEAFSSPEFRETAVAASMFTLGARDPDLGRRLIAEHIRDPQMREVAERQLQQGIERGSSPANAILGR
jgi:hypothetical protein